MARTWQKQIINGIECLVPFTEDDRDAFREIKSNKVVSGDIKGTMKERSLTQLKAYWACCRTVANNTDHHKWNTMSKVDWQLRNRLQFFDQDLTLVINGNVQFKHHSISFANLKHIEACNYFDRAFEMMSKFLKITVDELLDNRNAT